MQSYCSRQLPLWAGSAHANRSVLMLTHVLLRKEAACLGKVKAAHATRPVGAVVEPPESHAGASFASQPLNACHKASASGALRDSC